MTEISGGNLSKTFVVVSSTQPSSPFEGQLWRDTSNNTLKQWEGSSWVSIQLSADGVTITKNASGELQVEERTDVIMDWETDQGVWTEWNSPDRYSRDSTNAKNGAYHLRDKAKPNNTEGGMKREIDLTSYNTIKVWMWSNSASDVNNIIKIDSTYYLETTPSSSSSYIEYTVDVSDLSGTKTLKIGQKAINDNGDYNTYYVDYIRAINPSKLVKSGNNGAGGTT